MKDISLYVHIPFCRRKCAYCDFFSVPCKQSISDEYISALLFEIDALKQLHEISSFRTAYIGGGTPSLLSAEQLSRLCESIMKKSEKQIEEFTIEMNPDDVTKEKLDAVRSFGVNRLSLGIQSLNANALKAVSRRCSRETTLNALNLVKKEWSGRLSLDAIAGLPAQNREEFLKSLSEILDFGSEHISLYSLMIEDGTPLERAISGGRLQYDEDETDEQWLLGREMLSERGYNQYEVSNFSKPGAMSLHNSVYWHLKDYLGAGSGAAGSIFGKNGIRWQNSADIEKYTRFWLSQGKKNVEDFPRETELLSEETQETEFLMMGFRLLDGISENEYKARFGKDLSERLGEKDGVFSKWLSRGDAKIRKDGGDRFFSLSKSGILFLNTFLEAIL